MARIPSLCSRFLPSPAPSASAGRKARLCTRLSAPNVKPTRPGHHHHHHQGHPEPRPWWPRPPRPARLLPRSFSNPATHHGGAPPDALRRFPFRLPSPATAHSSALAECWPPRGGFAAFGSDKIPRPFCRRRRALKERKGGAEEGDEGGKAESAARILAFLGILSSLVARRGARGLLPAGSVSVTRPAHPWEKLPRCFLCFAACLPARPPAI